MKITCIGGGPAGLYFAILMKKQDPRHDITVYERNKPDDTFGWGVVFSDETLGGFGDADKESYDEIRRQFAYWDNIETYYTPNKTGEGSRGSGAGYTIHNPAIGETLTTSTGHGFCGMSRKAMLNVFHNRCRELGVKLIFEHDVKDPAEFKDSDLIIACDGVNSRIRDQYASSFKPSLDWRKCKFTWLGCDKPLKAFTFIFRENEHGLFQVHAYPFEHRASGSLSTFIVECREEVWKKAGLDKADEAATIAYCQKLFGDHLKGPNGESHRLLTNRSIWRTFPTIRCESWIHDNIVLMGDAAHTAHFSIGSGTKLAMEDAIALALAFKDHGSKGVKPALAAYQEARMPEVIRVQRAAQTSLEWFENSARFIGQHPLQFTFNLMTRSKRITYDNLKLRDAALVTSVNDWFANKAIAEAGVARAEPKTQNSQQPLPVPCFTPFRLREMTLENRIVVSPMCQYSAVEGMPTDWHLVHLGGFAKGGAGLVIVEATAVRPDGRITHGCTGLYSREHVAAYRRIVDFAHAYSKAKIGIQLAHAGRKASCSLPWAGDGPLKPDQQPWPTIGPSAIPFKPGWHVPREMTRRDMDEVRDAFVQSAKWAEEAGFDMLELHMAHGYLLSSFISPLTNRRTDAYGGDTAGRMKFPLEVFNAVRAVWPRHKPISVRLSTSDWMADDSGMTGDESVRVARLLKAAGCDIIDCSSAGNVPESRINYGRMYQVPFSDQIRNEAGIPTMAVGNIQDADQCNMVLAAGRADLCALARPHLADPFFTLHAAAKYEHWEQHWPNQYLASKPRPARR